MIEIDPLELRLSELKIATPEFRERATASRKAPVFSRAKVRRRGGMLLALALLVLGVAATYPAIGQDVLRWAGLVPSQVQPVSGAASYGGAHIEVSGGYADQIETVLFASFSANAACSVGPYLTDQYGEKYLLNGGWGLGVGAFPVIFDPLRGEAARTGAMLTLHCDISLATPPRQPVHDLQVKLNGKLTPRAAKTLATPAPVVADGTTYKVVQLVWSGTYLQVRTKISGKLIDDLVAKSEKIENTPCPQVCGVGFPGVFLVAPSGKIEIPVGGLSNPDFLANLQRDHVQDETRTFTASKPGTYRIVISRDEPNGRPIAQWTVNVS